MFTGKLVFAQTIDHLPLHTLRRCIQRYDVNLLDTLLPEAGAFYIMDRAYLDFERLYLFTLTSAFFLIRAKSNLKYRRLYSHPIDKSIGLRCDQTVVLTGFYSSQHYPDKLRRIKFHDLETNKMLIFLTNNFLLPAITITEWYKFRWQVELFFKWIKQHLGIPICRCSNASGYATSGRFQGRSYPCSQPDTENGRRGALLQAQNHKTASR